MGSVRRATSRFTDADHLLERLSLAARADRLRDALQDYVAPDVLVVDEVAAGMSRKSNGRAARLPETPAEPRLPCCRDSALLITGVVALAHRWRDLIRSGVVKDQAALAALVGVSRARVSQVMALLYLAPDIQEEVLDLPTTSTGCDPIHHQDLTRIAAEPAWDAQRPVWRDARVCCALRAGALPAAAPPGASSAP